MSCRGKSSEGAIYRKVGSVEWNEQDRSENLIRCVSYLRNEEVYMPVSSQWEYLTVLVSTELLDYEELHPKSVNGQELKSWKKIDLNTFLSQLGADYWEMTGTISISAGEHRAGANYLFFKRVKP